MYHVGGIRMVKIKWFMFIILFFTSILLIQQVSGLSKASVWSNAAYTTTTQENALIAISGDLAADLQPNQREQTIQADVLNRMTSNVVFQPRTLYSNDGITVTSEGGIFTTGIIYTLPILVAVAPGTQFGDYSIPVIFEAVWEGGRTKITKTITIHYSATSHGCGNGNGNGNPHCN
jgi:hypothetical protein